MKRTCPRCGIQTADTMCCGIIFARRVRWRMTKLLVRRVHIIARVEKGLTREVYELRLKAVGVSTCKDFSRAQYREFMRGLATLPNVPGKVWGRAA